MQPARTPTLLARHCYCNSHSHSHSQRTSRTTSSSLPAPRSSHPQHQYDGRSNSKKQIQLPLCGEKNDVHLLGELNPQREKSPRSLSALLLHYANNGFFAEAQTLCDQILYSSLLVPTTHTGIDLDLVSSLINCYVQMGLFHDILPILDDITSRQPSHDEISQNIYTLGVCCFGNAGQLELMEETLKIMSSKGLKIDSFTGNTFVKYYSHHGSIHEMEFAYQRLKKTRISIEKDTIRAMASAYIHERKYFKLGEFVKDVGLRRLNLGNLLWNLLLLSYAANFKMKTLQKEFLNMLDNGFRPDLNTFNIRALAFSKMCMFWDLHLSLDHMKNECVGPDLITYGCFVDAYLERRLARNLSFALQKMDTGRKAVIRTDPLVFEAFGKGDFHASSESLLESAKHTRWSYAEMVRVYLKKKYRSQQIETGILVAPRSGLVQLLQLYASGAAGTDSTVLQLMVLDVVRRCHCQA